MPATEFKLGIDAKLYYNSATSGDPTWVEIGNAKDVTLSIEGDEADLNVRANSPWKASATSLLDAGIEWQQQWRRNDVTKSFLMAALLSRTIVDIMALDGAYTDPDSEGLRFDGQIRQGNREEPLAESLTLSLSAKPTLTSQKPRYGTCGSGDLGFTTSSSGA